MLHHHRKLLLVFVGCLFLCNSCYKDKTVILETSGEITRTVSFKNDILTIFNSSCNTAGCHISGGKSPDLSLTNAYTTLSNGGFLDINNPSESLLYLWMAGKKGTPMPVSGINKDYNALILAWIKQGAQNN